MKTARVNKLWSKHNLPTELQLEILSRLPAKSLLRFRCVSKSWLSLIDDPDFCVLHLKNFKNNCNETHLFVVQYEGETQNYVVRTSHTFRTPTRLNYIDAVNGSCQSLTASPILRHRWRALCSVDGLVMIKHLTTPVELVLWNPSIRRARTLTPSPAISEGMFNVELGFGYNPLLKDYQHVRFVQAGKINLHLVEIYTFRLGLWKTIKFQGKGISNWLWSFPDVQYKWKTVCLKGVIYFTAWKLNSETQELAAFDLRDEVFASTSLPAEGDLSSKGSVYKALLLLDDGSSLGVIYHVPTEGSIWVMESSEGDIVSKCWTKRYTFASGIRNSKAFDGRSLFYRHLKKNGNMILMYERQVTSYNLETHKEKILLANGRNLIMPDVWGYKESLLML